jgi:hypothetical protein
MVHMQSGADRQLGIDAPCDRNAREALVRVGVVAYERFVADAIMMRAAAKRRKQSRKSSVAPGRGGP